MSIVPRQKLVSANKYSIKCPHSMSAEYITVHNTANDASAENEIQYMITNNNEVSYHFAIDGDEVVQGIPLNKNAWHCGDGAKGTGNRKSIGVEICYSKSGGERYKKAEQQSIKFIAQLLYERKWGVDKVKKHADWARKNCPHRILDEGRWDSFIKAIDSELKALSTPITKPAVANNNEPDQWAKVAADWCVKEGITDGTNPKNIITRQEVWTMIYRALNK